MKAKLLLIVLVVATGTIFAQSTEIQGASVSKFQSSQLENSGNLFLVPLKAEIKVTAKQPVAYVMQETFSIPNKRKKEREEVFETRLKEFVNFKFEELKAQALFEFITKENCSVIVSPIYSIKTIKSSGLQITVEVRVTGYPATYTNFRNVEDKDSTIIFLNNLIDRQQEVQIITDKLEKETTEKVQEVKRN